MTEQRTEISPIQLREWLATKPRDEGYNFYLFWECALAQFAKYLHPEAAFVGGGAADFHADEHRYTIVPSAAVEATWDALGLKHDHHIEGKWTFGETVDELDKQLAAAA